MSGLAVLPHIDAHRLSRAQDLFECLEWVLIDVSPARKVIARSSRDIGEGHQWGLGGPQASERLIERPVTTDDDQNGLVVSGKVTDLFGELNRMTSVLGDLNLIIEVSLFKIG